MKCKTCKRQHESAYYFATATLCEECYEALPAERKTALSAEYDLFRAKLGFRTAATPALQAASQEEGGLCGGVLLFLAGPAFLGLTTGPFNPSGYAIWVGLVCWIGAAASIARRRRAALICIAVVLCAGGLPLLFALNEVAEAAGRVDPKRAWLFLAFRGGIGVPLVALSLWSVLGIPKTKPRLRSAPPTTPESSGARPRI